MTTYHENRDKIHKKLYEINTTMDKEEAYQATIDYIMKVATDAWIGAARQHGWENDNIEEEIKYDLWKLGLIKT